MSDGPGAFFVGLVVGIVLCLFIGAGVGKVVQREERFEVDAVSAGAARWVVKDGVRAFEWIPAVVREDAGSE